MRGPRPFRLFLIVILALTPLVQSFWFGRAWRVIDAVAWPGPRTLSQGLWIVAALVVLAAALHFEVPPRTMHGHPGFEGVIVILHIRKDRDETRKLVRLHVAEQERGRYPGEGPPLT